MIAEIPDTDPHELEHVGDILPRVLTWAFVLQLVKTVEAETRAEVDWEWFLRLNGRG